MIIHASVAKLYRHIGNPEFEKTMALISAANEEGLDTYEFDIDRLDKSIYMEILEAMDQMGYEVWLDENTMVMGVGLP